MSREQQLARKVEKHVELMEGVARSLVNGLEVFVEVGVASALSTGRRTQLRSLLERLRTANDTALASLGEDNPSPPSLARGGAVLRQ